MILLAGSRPGPELSPSSACSLCPGLGGLRSTWQASPFGRGCQQLCWWHWSDKYAVFSCPRQVGLRGVCVLFQMQSTV